MNVRQETTHSPDAGTLPRDDPQPVSLETLAAIEQAFAQVLRHLRERVGTRATDGSAEYESWLPPRH